SSMPSLSNFISTMEKLDSQGKNWVVFEQTFTLAVKQKDVWAHFNGTSKCPVPANPESPDKTEKKAIKTWEKAESLAAYMLMLKLAPVTHAKHRRKGTVAAMWTAIVAEFSGKLLVQCSAL
ncbi:hypothetical protein BC628DRAFT_1291931, partial [Trametes gibbosa]